MPQIALRRRWLTRIFATLGAAIMIVSAILLATVIRQVSTHQLHEVARQNSAALGRAAANRIWARVDATHANRGIPRPVPQPGGEIEPPIGAVSQFLTEAGVMSITLHDLSGRVLFTSGSPGRHMGPPRQQRIDNAATGEIDTRIDFHELIEAGNGILQDRWLVSTFAPFRPTGRGDVRAIVEVVADVTDLHNMAANAEVELLLIISVAFALVYLLLLAIVWRANVLTDARHAGHIERVSEEAKADAKTLIETLMQAWPDFVYVKDVESRFVLANPATARVMGAAASTEIAGKTDFDFFPDDVAQDFYDSEQEMLATGKSVIGRLEHVVSPDGNTVWFSTTKMPYRGSSGTIRGFIGIGREVTAERKAAAHLKQAKEEAEYANRSKSEFLATMSHELRTPLNAIIGFSEIIKSEAFGPTGNATYKEYAKDINESGAHLLELINDILDLSKIEAGSMELSDDTVQLDAILRGVHVLVKERAHDAEVRLTFPMAVHLPTIRADERKVKQILVNLLSNAIKFTEPGGQVSVSIDSDQTGVVMCVADTGIGIPAAAIDKALEPFGQVESQLSRKYDGSGLGLPLAKRFAELHGGTLTIDSEPGRGTAVTVRFPLSRMIGPARANA